MFERAATIAPDRLDYQRRIGIGSTRANTTSSRASSQQARRWRRGAGGSCVKRGDMRVYGPRIYPGDTGHLVALCQKEFLGGCFFATESCLLWE